MPRESPVSLPRISANRRCKLEPIDSTCECERCAPNTRSVLRKLLLPPLRQPPPAPHPDEPDHQSPHHAAPQPGSALPAVFEASSAIESARFQHLAQRYQSLADAEQGQLDHQRPVIHGLLTVKNTNGSKRCNPLFVGHRRIHREASSSA
jgi:hypothetical protein